MGEGPSVIYPLNDELLATALSQAGVRSIPGEQDTPAVKRYLSTVGLGRNDDDAWCSAFMVWVFEQVTGHRIATAAARSWISPPKLPDHLIQMAIDVSHATPGDVVTIWRVSPQSWQGHVGLFCRATRSHVWLLGGNQGRQVSIKAYPRDRILAVNRYSR